MLQVSEIRSFVLSCSYFSRVVSKSLSGSSDSKIMIALYLFSLPFPDSNTYKHLQTSPKHLSHTTKTFSVSTIIRPREFSKFKLTTDCSFSRKPYLPARIARNAHSFPPKLTYMRASRASYAAAWEALDEACAHGYRRIEAKVLWAHGYRN